MPLWPVQSVIAAARGASDRRWQSWMQRTSAESEQRLLDARKAIEEAGLEAQREMTDAMTTALDAVAESTKALGEIEDKQNELTEKIAEDTAALRLAIDESKKAIEKKLGDVLKMLTAWTPTGGGLTAAGAGGWPAITGEIRWLYGQAAPPGWLHCDGSYHRIADRPELWSVLGVRYGEISTTGVGQTHFRMPQKSDLTADAVVLADSAIIAIMRA